MRSRPFCASLLLLWGCGSPPTGSAPDPEEALEAHPPPEKVLFRADRDEEFHRRHAEWEIRQDHALRHLQGEEHPMGGEVFAQAAGHTVEIDIQVSVEVEDTVDSEPTIEDRVEQVLEAETPGEKVAIQVETVDQQIKDADAFNEDLEDILNELRAKKGLPDAPAYKAPTEVAAEKALKDHESKLKTLHLVEDPLLRVHRASLEGDAPAVEAGQESHPDSEKE